jgi:hypothetical protein
MAPRLGLHRVVRHGLPVTHGYVVNVAEHAFQAILSLRRPLALVPHTRPCTACSKRRTPRLLVLGQRHLLLVSHLVIVLLRLLLNVANVAIVVVTHTVLLVLVICGLVGMQIVVGRHERYTWNMSNVQKHHVRDGHTAAAVCYVGHVAGNVGATRQESVAVADAQVSHMRMVVRGVAWLLL